MLSDFPIAGRVAQALNLVVLNGRLRTRNGWVQRFADDVQRVVPWGDRVLCLTTAGRLAVWDGRLHDLGAQAALLDGAAFAVIRESAQREDRIYWCDAQQLRYVYPTGGGYALGTVTNSVVDGAGDPYPIESPALLAVWRGRLWVSRGDNRIRHSQLEDPAHLDPLWTLEFQSPRADIVRALVPHGDQLVVACQRSLWAVTGNSQYDWVVSQVVDGRGAVGRDALASDGERLFYLAEGGVYQLGRDQALSDPDLSETFRAFDPAGSLALTADGRHLWVSVHGRLLVLDTLDGGWTELDASPRAVLEFGVGAGWYGDAGLWVQGQRADADLLADGALREVAAVMEGWDVLPNSRGRSVLERGFLSVLAPRGGLLTLTVVIDGVDGPARVFEMAPASGLDADQLAFWDGVLRAAGARPVALEAPIGRAGWAFRPRFALNAPAELVSHELVFRGGRQ